MTLEPTAKLSEQAFAALTLPHRISFLDLGAGTLDRLDHWRAMERQKGVSEQEISASFAVDVNPRAQGVLQADALQLLRSLPNHSVKEINCDFFYISENSTRTDSDGSTYGFSEIILSVKRALALDGVFWATLSLAFDNEFRTIVEQCGMTIKPVAFGYVGFLGGENARFPSAGLPPIEQVTPEIKKRCLVTKYREEEDPLAAVFAEKIGTHAYVGDNPVRYSIIHRSKRV